MEVKNYNNLLVEIEDGIAVITINRPKSLNALNSETLAELGDIAAAIEKAKDVKVVILTGSGQKSFVAGADISSGTEGGSTSAGDASGVKELSD